jgi:endogenous inhibitor of DNA gyrase (YacG/DUF329 family)
MTTFECPTCGTLTTAARREEVPYRPFCSYRCKMIDLGRWLDGTYAVSEPIVPEEFAEEDRPPRDDGP